MLALRTPAELLRLCGRVLLWCLLALLLVRGAADVLGARDRPAVARQASPVPASWPDDEARAFAVDFTRAYLSYSPRHPDAYLRGLAPFMASDLASSVAPRFAQRNSRQVVLDATVARAERVAAGRALVTVAATLASPGLTTRYLTVPVARDARDGLAVYDLPSFAPPPAQAQVQVSQGEPLVGVQRAQVEDVLSRFFGAFLAGRSHDLEYFAPAGVHIGALAQPFELVGLDSISQLGSAARGRLTVLASVRARDVQTRAVYPLRYLVRLVRTDRWYVAAVNTIHEED